MYTFIINNKEIELVVFTIKEIESLTEYFRKLHKKTQ